MANEQSYRIGAVERLTGIAAVTIRMWERRYKAVEPYRTPANGRLYSRAQVARLAMLKQLVDAGHAISTVASLSDVELGQRLAGLPDFRPTLSGPVGAVVVGPHLGMEWPESGASDSNMTVACHVTPEAALAAPPEVADVLVVELTIITPDSAQLIRRLAEHVSATTVMVIYQFGNSENLAQLHRAGVHTVSAPVRVAELQKMLPALVNATPAAVDSSMPDPAGFLKEPPPARRFTDLELRRWAGQARSVQCECPEHLAALITKLSAFESYSRDCESRNPTDAAVHTLLFHTTARARRMMEDALHHLIEHEFGKGAAEPDGD